MTQTETRPAGATPARPGSPTTRHDVLSFGFQPFDLEIEGEVEVPGHGQGLRWRTLGDVPQCAGVYLFTTEMGHDLRVVYVGLTEHLWMVTHGCYPDGRSRPGQRYGRPFHAGETRKRINVQAATQIRLGATLRHWVCPIPDGAANRSLLLAVEEEAIDRWQLRRVGWNKR